MDIRKNLRNLWRAAKVFFLKLVRIYTLNTPIAKGKHRIYLIALYAFRDLPDEILVKAPDGRRFSADLSTGMQHTLFFIGEYEKAITNIVERLIIENRCKIFLDVGANFGWYTTLFYKYAKEGEVH